MKRTTPVLLITVVALLISSCERQILPPTQVILISPRVIISTATPIPTDTVDPASPTPPPSDTPIPTDTDTPIPTDTSVPTDTPTSIPPTETFTPVPVQVEAVATQPPAPTAIPVASAIIPDVQGCNARLDIDGQLYGHAFVQSPVANDNGQMKVQYFVNGATVFQDFPVQQVLNLGPFKDGDVVSDGSDSWQCVTPTPGPAGPPNNSSCYCVMVPTSNGFYRLSRHILHVKVCYDAKGNVVPSCPLLAYCVRNSARE